MAGKVYLGDTFIGYSNKKILVDFGGLNLAPGPLYQNTSSGEYGICDTWDQYNSYGENSPSIQTYFSWGILCDAFDSTGDLADSTMRKSYQAFNSSGTYTIDNQKHPVTWNDVNDWRLPTYNEQLSLYTGYTYTYNSSGNFYYTKVRNGSTVNNVDNITSVAIVLTNTGAAYSTPSGGYYGTPGNAICGILFIPEGKTITGTNIFYTGSYGTTNYYVSTTAPNVPLSYSDLTILSLGLTSATPMSGLPQLTTSQLNEYISQGCVFMPLSGYRFTDVSGTSSWMPPYSSSNNVSFNNVWLNTYLETVVSTGTFRTYVPESTSGMLYQCLVHEDLGTTIGTGYAIASPFQTYLVRSV